MAEDLDQIETAFMSGKSFALASLPFSDENMVFLENEKGELRASDGSKWFVKAFDDTEKPLRETSFEEYNSVLNESIDLLKSKSLRKVVLSKVKKATFDFELSPSALFHVLRQKYPSAFKFIYRVKNGNVWFGATPEILLDKGKLVQDHSVSRHTPKIG
ncbi:MAG: chorismate-binding protein [Flavobacteriales bacterium]